MVYTTKFHKIGMFKRFILLGITYVRVGRNLYEDVTAGEQRTIDSLGTRVIQVVDKYYWTPQP